MADSEWSGLSQHLQDGFTRYGIKEAEWNLIRRAPEAWGGPTDQVFKKGTTFLTAESIDNLPDALVENYLRKTGQLTTKNTPKENRMPTAIVLIMKKAMTTTQP
jgi:hypothetical protein